MESNSHQMPKRLQLMKRFAPIAAIAVASLLLESCQPKTDTLSKRHICAQFTAYITHLPEKDELIKYWERLEIGPMPKGMDKADYLEEAIYAYCEFYKP